MRKELDGYKHVLLGRRLPEIDAGVATLMEYAGIALGRALEVQQLIHRAENDGRVSRGSTWYLFRTGELRDYIDIFKGAFDLGSRRITMAKQEYEMEYGTF